MSEISPILVLQTKQVSKKTDMTKVAIKNENITSFGGIYSISLWLFILPHWLGWGILCLEKTQETPKYLISTYRAPKKTSQHIKSTRKEKRCGIEDKIKRRK
ncbi:hypothetical protein [Alloprevotella tannerae]|uniref:hypothetical protein n=1 Tax=Alloprevotella tannerae TaxID=76122 RepID=UPI0028F0F5D3|nr:hypothetical protein [Alloprevotella tannerae]